eukprot:gnl/MRDRNA2_/MRDRNA2_165911_c0_seq1.p1 gnl/MRDRNA2_/MRDRNA2_165911_c0~~gnl/MRDRNA2_/MRDRNA2_165911_c0_seq1.p1  ORF type:complete len:382 (-),score=37.12 gnl/MRDRNA2_/MRDRNA2_165911_c0_seq1:70-1215(-)
MESPPTKRQKHFTEQQNVKRFHFDPTINPPPLADRPRQVVVFMRHGDRTPIDAKVGNLDLTHLGDKWKSLLPTVEERTAMDHFSVTRSSDAREGGTFAQFVGSAVHGQLTSMGFAQCKAVGAELRRRYDHSTICVFSTDFPRTIDSAKAALCGFAPQEDVMITIRSAADEILLPNYDGCCSRYADLQKHRQKLAMDRVSALRQALETGLKIPLGVSDNDAANGVVPEPSHFKTLCIHEKTVGQVAGVDVSLVNHMDKYYGELWSIMFEDLELLRLGCGRLLHWVESKLSSKPQGKPELFLLMAHDSTLVPLMMALSVHRRDWPIYASTVVLETADFQDSLKIRIVVNNDIRQDWLDLDNFRQSISELVMTPEQYQKHCDVL